MRCHGPAPQEGFQTSRTQFCDDTGRVIEVGTANKGGHPPTDPPARLTVTQTADAFHVRIETSVEDVDWRVPLSVGRELLDGMLSTVPMLDRRVWFPARGRGDELVAEYGADWWKRTLEDAGAREVEVREQPVVCTLVGGAPPCAPPPGPRPYEGAATAPDGSRVEFHVFAGGRQDEGVMMSVARAVTVGGTDILVVDGFGPAAQAHCGGMRFFFRPEGVGTTDRTEWDLRPAARLLAAVLAHLSC